MADELDNAIAEGLKLIRTVDGIRNVPDYPTESDPRLYPAAIATTQDAEWTKGDFGTVQGLHNIRLGVYIPRQDAPIDVAQIHPFGEKIKDVLFLNSEADNINATWNGTIDTINGPVKAKFGPLDYAGLKLFGWTFEIPVKIRSKQQGTKYVKG